MNVTEQRHVLSEVDPASRTATCRWCGPCTRIRRAGTTSAGTTRWSCVGRDKERPGATKRQRLSRYKKLRAAGADESQCAICHRSGIPLIADHCHRTNVPRGFLCRKCNSALGWFNDDPELLQAALDYLSTAGAAHSDRAHSAATDTRADDRLRPDSL